MKHNFLRPALILFILIPAWVFHAEAQQGQVSTAASLARWFAAGEWYRKTTPPKPVRTYDAFGRETGNANPDTLQARLLNDPVPGTVVNLAGFASAYNGNPQRWDIAFWWLRHTDFTTLGPGRYPIDGEDVYAIITEGEPKPLDSTEWESHRNFNDIHYVLGGKELIGIVPVEKVKLIRPYDAAKDLANYSGKGKYYRGDPGRFYIVTTAEAHRPGLKTEGCDHLKKLCIKVRKG